MKRKQPQFVMVPHSLVKLGKHLKHQTFRLIAYLRCFDPIYPSREQIKLEAGLTDAAITAGLKEAMRYNVLSYQRGNSSGKANSYTIHPEKDWQLPKAQRYSKKRGAHKTNEDHPSNLGASTSDSNLFAPQKGTPNQSNAKQSNCNKSNDRDQSKSNKDQFSNSTFDESFQNLTAHLHRFYGQLYPSLVGVPFDPVSEGKLGEDELSVILKRYIDYAKHGGSLFGLIRNDFARLGQKKQKRLPEPRFLAMKDSRKIYLSIIDSEVVNENFETCFGPFRFVIQDLRKKRYEDRKYLYAIRALRHLLKVKDIEQYVTDSLIAANQLPQLGAYLFKYAILKEYYFDEELKLTRKATKLYMRLVGHDSYEPFDFQVGRYPFAPEFEGWPDKGIRRGAGFQYEIDPITFPDLQGEEVIH